MTDQNGPQRLVEVVGTAFTRVPGYLDTAAVGLPPTRSVEVLHDRVGEWAEGRCSPQSFDPDVDSARAAYARITRSEPSSVAIVSQVSVAAGIVAASLPEGATVLCAEEEFTSVLFPFLADSRLRVHTVPFRELLETADSDIDLVAVSAAQSSSGEVTDLDRLAELAARRGFRTFVDVTQAAGWLDFDSEQFDVTSCHGYKWLCSPRGAGFMTVTASARDWVKPGGPGWYSGEDPWASIYGPPLRLAGDARRFDQSPAWFSYAAAVPALELLADLGPAAVGAYAVGLANEFREGFGQEPSNSPIVSVSTERGSRLAEAGIKASVRAGRVRLSFYVYNDRHDVQEALAALGAAT